MAKQPIAALRDCTFYARPSGFGHNPRPPKYHVIVLRASSDTLGPACGYPLHNEETERGAVTVALAQRCMRPGCRAQWTNIDNTAETRHD